MTSTYLAGDVGGTNARLLLVQVSKGENGVEVEKQIAQKVFESRRFTDLSSIIALFLSEQNISTSSPLYPAACALAVAGPVADNCCNITNLNWFLDGEQMAKMLHIRKVTLLNDFVAVGYGLLALKEDEKEELNAGHPQPKQPIAVLGAGTGLGEAYLTWNGREYDVWPSEGGHSSFAPRNDVEYKLFKYFKETERLPTVSVERVVSGMAIPKIYDFLCREYPKLINKQNDQAIRSSSDPAATISVMALQESDALCSQVFDIFVKCYGAEAGDLALKKLPFGGLYVAGGIAPKILPALKQQNKFVENMIQKGRMRAVLEKVPVYIVKHPQVGLLGAQVVCRRILRDMNQIPAKL